jgi:hypothetical protein
VQESFNRLSGLKPSIKSTQNTNTIKSCMKGSQLSNEQIEERFKVCVSEAIALGVKPPVPPQSEGQMNVRAHRYHISCLESQRHLIGKNLFSYVVHSFCLIVPFFCTAVCLSVCTSVCLSVCLYFCLSVCLSVCLYFCLSVCLYFCLSVCLSVLLSVVFLCLFSSLLTCASHLLSLSFSRSSSILSPDYSSVCTTFSFIISSFFLSL